MIAPSIWLLIALLKADLSCCSKRLKMLTVWEVKWRLWHLSKKRCITFKSESEAPYTARPYVRMGRTRVLNKWSISFWLKSSFRRVLRMWRQLLAFVSLSLTCSLDLQLGWKVSPSNTRLSHWGMLLMGAYWWRLPLFSFFLNISSLHLLGYTAWHSCEVYERANSAVSKTLYCRSECKALL